MAEPIIYKGRGTPDMYDDLMDFLNYVFGFNGNDSDFKKLLPKLYNPENDPCYANYVVTVDGKIKAGIGAFDSELSVGGEILKCRGIGNVAVHPYSRSKGYMKDCMHMAIDDMIKDGVDYSILGGRRQRYNYFGFEQAGPEYRAYINRNNMRYCFGDVPFTELDLHEVTAADTELLDRMHALHASRPEHTIRPREKFLDILHSWREPAFAVLKDGAFRGYFVGDLQELTLIDRADFVDVVRNYLRHHGDVTIKIPSWDYETLEAAQEFAEGVSIGNCDMFNIFNYKRFVGAFLRFKSSYELLADGEITLLIHGMAGDEKLRISVENRQPSVEVFDGDCDLTLEHREAITFFFGNHSAKRRLLPPGVREWFPLPLYIEGADHV